MEASFLGFQDARNWRLMKLHEVKKTQQHPKSLIESLRHLDDHTAALSSHVKYGAPYFVGTERLVVTATNSQALTLSQRP